MELKLYDTLTREKRVFTPLDRANVRMYVCGPTVYDFAHIGNARPVIVFDVLFRLLRHLYGADHVVYVRNITDVDDKINARAAEEYPDLPLNQAIRRVTEQTDKQFHEDVAALGCLPPTVEPRATEHIAEMKALIERLVTQGCAYVAAEPVLIHGGGIDLVFPHHENEIAQTRCAFHTPEMANVWMHNGFLQVEGRKMAKSEGNFITIRELFDGWKGKRWRRQEIRLLMLSTQYRQPLDWTLQGLEETQRMISHWEQITANVDYDFIEIKPSESVESALLDDLNTPDAIFHLHELAKSARASRSAANELYANLVFLAVFADRRADADLARKLAEQRKDLSTEQKIRWIVSNLDS